MRSLMLLVAVILCAIAAVILLLVDVPDVNLALGLFAAGVATKYASELVDGRP